MLNVLTLKSKNIFQNFSIQCLRRRLPGYLILFATYAFVPQRQLLLKSRLRFWYSFIDLQMSPLLMKFYSSAQNSSKVVLISYN